MVRVCHEGRLRTISLASSDLPDPLGPDRMMGEVLPVLLVQIAWSCLRSLMALAELPCVMDDGSRLLLLGGSSEARELASSTVILL